MSAVFSLTRPLDTPLIVKPQIAQQELRLTEFKTVKGEEALDARIQAFFSNDAIVDNTLSLRVAIGDVKEYCTLAKEVSKPDFYLHYSNMNAFKTKYEQKGFLVEYNNDTFSISIPAPKGEDTAVSEEVTFARTNLQRNTEEAYARVREEIQKELNNKPTRLSHKFTISEATTVDETVRNWILDSVIKAGFVIKRKHSQMTVYNPESLAYKFVQTIKSAMDSSLESSKNFTYPCTTQVFSKEELQEELGEGFAVSIVKVAEDYKITVIDIEKTTEETVQEIEQKLKKSQGTYCHNIRLISQTKYEFECVKKHLKHKNLAFSECAENRFNNAWISVRNPNYDFTKDYSRQVMIITALATCCFFIGKNILA